MENKSIFAYILLILSLAISIYFVIYPKSLMPRGYDLAIDGYVISRTLMIIFTLYLTSKIGFLFINKKD